MQIYNFIPIIVSFIALFIIMRSRDQEVPRKIIQKRKGEDKTMIELAKRFIDKDCLIYAYDGEEFDGVIREVSNSAVWVEKDGKMEAINLDYVTRIREYPRDKKGKRKSLVLD